MSKTTVSEIIEGVALARPLAQALIWGGGSALSSSIADKKRIRKALAVGLIGAGAGDGSYYMDQYLGKRSTS